MLTGYFGDAGQVAAGRPADRRRQGGQPGGASISAIPIIGDTGSLFQPEAVAAAIRDRLLPLADIATPNRFECRLAGQPATRCGRAPARPGRWSSPRRATPRRHHRHVVVTAAAARLSVEPSLAGGQHRPRHRRPLRRPLSRPSPRRRARRRTPPPAPRAPSAPWSTAAAPRRPRRTAARRRPGRRSAARPPASPSPTSKRLTRLRSRAGTRRSGSRDRTPPSAIAVLTTSAASGSVGGQASRIAGIDAVVERVGAAGDTRRSGRTRRGSAAPPRRRSPAGASPRRTPWRSRSRSAG